MSSGEEKKDSNEYIINALIMHRQAKNTVREWNEEEKDTTRHKLEVDNESLKNEVLKLRKNFEKNIETEELEDKIKEKVFYEFVRRMIQRTFEQTNLDCSPSDLEDLERNMLIHSADNQHVFFISCYVISSGDPDSRRCFGMKFLKTKPKLQLRSSFVFKKIYIGEFTIDNNIMIHYDGIGTLYDPKNNTLFEGDFRMGKKNGKGIESVVQKSFSSYSDHIQVFEGRYSNDKRHGRGEHYDIKTGEVYRGNWVNGVLSEKSVFKFDSPIYPYSTLERHIQNSKVLGFGGNGIVYEVDSSVFPQIIVHDKEEVEGEEKNPDKHHSSLAVKIMKCESNFQKRLVSRMIKRGIALSSSLKSSFISMKNHNNILEVYGIIQGNMVVGYVMEKCRTSIDKLIQKASQIKKFSRKVIDSPMIGFEMSDKIDLLYQTATGMKVLHQHNIMHRDLKWGNVMVSDSGVVKITDFDTLKEDEADFRLRSIAQSSRIGTTGHLSPEVFLGKKYSLKCDVFAFGMMIYSIFWELPVPYSSRHSCNCGVHLDSIFVSNSLDYHVANCNLRPSVESKDMERFPSLLIDLMIQAWDRDPFQRPSFDEIVQRLKMEKVESKNYRILNFKFPKHSGVKYQKMYLTKPFLLSKIAEWLEEKFNRPDDSSFYDVVVAEDEEKKNKRTRKTKVVSIEHPIMGDIETDEDLREILSTRQIATFGVELDSIDEEYVFYEHDRKISFQEYQILKDKNEEYRRVNMELKAMNRVILEENSELKKEKEKFESEIERLKKVVLNQKK